MPLDEIARMYTDIGVYLSKIYVPEPVLREIEEQMRREEDAGVTPPLDDEDDESSHQGDPP